MADSISGAGGELTIGSTTLQPEDGLGDWELIPNAATFDVVSGGLSTVEQAGPVAWSGSFSCLETERTNGVLLGRNSVRVNLKYEDTDGTDRLDAECVLGVTRTLEDRGARRFEVEFTVDGAPT